LAPTSGAPSWPIETGAVPSDTSGTEPVGMPEALTPCVRQASVIAFAQGVDALGVL
jgi:hypothetical protein